MRSNHCIVTQLHPLALILSAASLGVVGCGEDSGRFSVEGSVSLDGVAVEDGNISFLPLPGTDSPTAGATIKAGRFTVPRDKGLKPGEFEVSIKAVRLTGRKIADQETGEMIDQREQFIPDRYHRNTELRAQIQAEVENVLTYDLTSK